MSNKTLEGNPPERAGAAEPKLLDRVRDRLRLKHYSIRTEAAYLGWIKRFILFHGKQHPAQIGKMEVEAFLTSLAVERDVAAATQAQALSAILFLYQEVLGMALPWLDEVTRAKKPVRLPSVLSTSEVSALIGAIDDPEMALIVRLLYGSGMRLLECLRLRIKDVDFARREIVVREGKGNKDRVTMLPASVAEPLKAKVRMREHEHGIDLVNGVPYICRMRWP